MSSSFSWKPYSRYFGTCTTTGRALHIILRGMVLKERKGHACLCGVIVRSPFRKELREGFHWSRRGDFKNFFFGEPGLTWTTAAKQNLHRRLQKVECTVLFYFILSLFLETFELICSSFSLSGDAVKGNKIKRIAFPRSIEVIDRKSIAIDLKDEIGHLKGLEHFQIPAQGVRWQYWRLEIQSPCRGCLGTEKSKKVEVVFGIDRLATVSVGITELISAIFSLSQRQAKDVRSTKTQSLEFCDVCLFIALRDVFWS